MSTSHFACPATKSFYNTSLSFITISTFFWFFVWVSLMRLSSHKWTTTCFSFTFFVLHLFFPIFGIIIDFQATSSMSSGTGTSETTISLDYTSLQIVATFAFLFWIFIKIWRCLCRLIDLIKIVIYNTNDSNWILFRSSYLQEWIWMIFSGFTIFTKIKIFLYWRFIASSDYRVHITAVTNKIFVYRFLLFLHFDRILVLDNHFADLRNQILEFRSN